MPLEIDAEIADAINVLTEWSGPNKAALTVIVTELIVMGRRFVLAQEKQADMLMFLARAAEKAVKIK